MRLGLACIARHRLPPLLRSGRVNLAGMAAPALGTTPKTAEGAKTLYDEWASSYDAALESWGYQIPKRIAEELSSRGCNNLSRILDLGCGTGLSGAALRAADLGTTGGVVGTDISQTSLDLAMAKGLYSSVVYANLDEALPFGTESFDAVGCAGVLSYVERPDVLFPELARVLRPGGVFVTSHRSSFWDEDVRGCRTAATALDAEGAWSIEAVGEPEPYMPKNPDPKESAKSVRLLCFRRSG